MRFVLALVEAVEVEEKASELRFRKVEEVVLYPNYYLVPWPLDHLGIPSFRIPYVVNDIGSFEFQSH